MNTKTIINIDSIIASIKDDIRKLRRRNYKVYKVLMEQTGEQAPTVKVIENTLGNIVWTRDGNGSYIGTLTGAFPENKCWFSAMAASVWGDTIHSITFGRSNNNSVLLLSFNNGSQNDFNTNGSYEVSILIEVYN